MPTRKAGSRKTIDSLETAYDEAVRLLARKPRSAAEVKDELLSRGAAADDVESVLGRLKAHRHLDDAELAGDEAFKLLEAKGFAPQLAVQTLLARGISAALAEEAVQAAGEGRSERELCARVLGRRLKGRRLGEAAAAKEGRALGRLGWDEDVVQQVLEAALREGRDGSDA